MCQKVRSLWGEEYVRGVFGSFPSIQDSNNKVECGVDCLTKSVRQLTAYLHRHVICHWQTNLLACLLALWVGRQNRTEQSRVCIKYWTNCQFQHVGNHKQLFQLPSLVDKQTVLTDLEVVVLSLKQLTFCHCGLFDRLPVGQQSRIKIGEDKNPLFLSQLLFLY